MNRKTTIFIMLILLSSILFSMNNIEYMIKNKELIVKTSLGEIKGDHVLDEKGKQVGTIKEKALYEKKRCVAILNNNKIIDDKGKKIGTLSEVKRLIKGAGKNIHLVALWYFFVKE